MKYALLIDADNVASSSIKKIIETASDLGVVTYKRIYADWTKPNSRSWKDVLLEYSLTPIQQYAYTRGKNATDSAMIIDAMDILYTNKVDGFLLASSDSDFTRLAARLREAGMNVVGMGKSQTPKAFVASCNKFFFLDVIDEALEQPQEEKASADKKQEKTIKTAKKKVESSRTPVEVVKKAINKCIDEHLDTPNGYVLVSIVGSHMANLFPDFHSHNYGKKKLVDLLKYFGYEIKASEEHANDKNPHSIVYYVRIPKNNNGQSAQNGQADKNNQTSQTSLATHKNDEKKPLKKSRNYKKKA